MKKVTTVVLIALTILFWSCNNSKQKNEKKETETFQAITKTAIVGEWQCTDITDGVTHMDNIAKMQPHLVFKENNSIFSKMMLPDGTNMSQKVGNYEIKNGKLVSKFLNNDVVLQNNKLIINHKDEDSKWIYKKTEK